MAKYVIIRDEGGISRFERRSTPIIDLGSGGKKAIDILRNVDLSISQVDLAKEYGQLGAVIVEAHQSDRLTDEEKRRFTALLAEYDFITDSISEEKIIGDYERTHPKTHVTDPGPHPPPADRVIAGVYDP